MNLKKVLPPLMVGLGAIFYGVPATIYKMASNTHLNSGHLVIWIFSISAVILNSLGLLAEKKVHLHLSFKRQSQLLLAGLPVALTNMFYMLALKYTSVAVTAVMIMQSVWLALIMGALHEKKWPKTQQIFGVFLILIGTVFAAGVFPLKETLSPIGMLLGLASALTYATTIHLTGDLGLDLPPLTKVRFMALGSAIMILIFWGHTLGDWQNFLGTFKWGALSSIFSMMVPLVAYAYFMPKLSLGLGPILSALELPFSIIFAYLILGEKITLTQGLGVVLIIATIVWVNVAPMPHGVKEKSLTKLNLKTK